MKLPQHILNLRVENKGTKLKKSKKASQKTTPESSNNRSKNKKKLKENIIKLKGRKFDGRLLSQIEKYENLICTRPIHFSKKFNIGIDRIFEFLKKNGRSKKNNPMIKLDKEDIVLLNSFIEKVSSGVIETNNDEESAFGLNSKKKHLKPKNKNKKGKSRKKIWLIYTPVGGKVR